MTQQKNLPFRKWVPYGAGIAAAFVVLVPVMLINGAYTGISINISNSLGVLSEDISMAYYAASAGMAAAYPIVPKIRAIVTTKTVLLLDLIVQVFFCLICARTTHMEVIIVCSFLIGILKAFAMLEMIILLKPFFSPRNVRVEFYSYFYPIVFSVGQVSMVVTAQLAYSYRWQYIYYAVMILLFLAIAVVLVVFRYGRRPIRFPYKEIDWTSLFLVSAVLLLFIYICTYGKVKDWFASGQLVICAALIPVFLYLFVRRQQRAVTPYLRLEVLSSPKAAVGYLYMAIAMFFSASSALTSSYVNTVLQVDSVHANALYLWMIPGFVAGAVFCRWWYKRQYRFRVLAAWGIACFVAYLAILYFGLMPGGRYEYLRLPMLLRGAGMMIIFIAFGVYAVEDMNPKLMIYNAFFLIGIRSALSPAMSAAFFNNLLYRTQQQNLAILAEGLDVQNPLAMSRYTQALNNALGQHHSLTDAQLLAANSLYTTVQVQSLLLSIKQIIGYMLIAAILVAVVTRFIPFHKTRIVKTVKTGEDMA
ncbi:MAG: MFS transporter [Parabacteroides sp.]|nr:MFS transporter [Parabacteroides sp.]